MAATTFMRSWQDFDLINMVVLPLFLFSATFYPIDGLPGGAPRADRADAAVPGRGPDPVAGRSALVEPSILWHVAYLGGDGHDRAVDRGAAAGPAAAEVGRRASSRRPPGPEHPGCSRIRPPRRRTSRRSTQRSSPAGAARGSWSGARVGPQKVARFRDETYWGRPVPGFGTRTPGSCSSGSPRPPTAPTGPGACSPATPRATSSGAPCTRPAWRAGPIGRRAGDGLTLHGVRVVAAVRCAPPANKPTTAERATCRPYLVRELALLPELRVIVALGAIGWDAALRALAALGHPVPKPRPRFAHGAEALVGPYTLLGTYHPSQQNTFTGVLTPPMLGDVLAARDRPLAGLEPRQPIDSPDPWQQNATTTRCWASSATRQRRRHQAGLPQARPAVAPGRQHGAGGARPLQGDQRGLPGPLRSPAAPDLRHVRPGGRRRRRRHGRRPGLRHGGLRRLLGHLRRLLRRRGGRRSPARTADHRLGPPLRPAHHVRRGGPRHREGDRVPGPRPLRHVRRLRREGRARPRRSAPSATAAARSAAIRQTMLGQMVNVAPCPRCRGEGRIIESPCDDLPRRGPHGAPPEPARDHPGRHRRGPPDPALQRGRDRAARRRPGQPVRRGPRGRSPVAHARGHRALLRGRRLDRPGGAGHEAPRADGGRRGAEVEIKAGTQPGTEIRLRGRGVPHLRRQSVRGDLHVIVNVVVPTKLSKRQREMLEAYAKEAGESVSAGGGLREKLGL